MISKQYPTAQRFLQYLRRYRKDIPIAIFFIVINATAQALGPVVIGWLIDHVISQGKRLLLVETLVVLVSIYFAGFLAARQQITRISWIMQRLLTQLRQDIFVKLQNLPISFFDQSKTGDLMSRLLNDVDTVNQVFGPAIPQILGSLLSLVGITIAMVSINLELGLLTNIVVPVIIILTISFGRWSRNKFRLTRQTISELSTKLQEDIASVREAQAFNRTQVNTSQFSKLNAANRDANIQAVAITAAFLPLIDVLNTLATAIVLSYGGYLTITGVMTVGTVTAFLIYIQQFFQPIQILSQFYSQSQSAFAGLERIFLLLDEPEYLTDVINATELPLIKGEVKFENVSFGYKPNQLVLKDINLYAQPGQMIALVGATGAGKTTIINLILRFYDVSSGTITIDGVDISTVTQASLRRQIGIVPQDTILFSGTVAENIAFGNPQATLTEIEIAAKTANLHELIMNLPQGYDTVLGKNGITLSQGQRQLISIARAVLINPQILILDEATSNIDTHTEVLVQDAISQLLTNRTSFVIAHRLSTVTKADQVLVIQDGQIIERGTHNELIAKHGNYANLYALQLGSSRR